jgi:hypothetical protein
MDDGDDDDEGQGDDDMTDGRRDDMIYDWAFPSTWSCVFGSSVKRVWVKLRCTTDMY